MGRGIIIEMPRGAEKTEPVLQPARYRDVTDLQRRDGESVLDDHTPARVLASEIFGKQNTIERGRYYSIEPLTGRVVISSAHNTRIEQMTTHTFIGGVVYAAAAEGTLEMAGHITPRTVDEATFFVGGFAVNEFYKEIGRDSEVQR